MLWAWLQLGGGLVIAGSGAAIAGVTTAITFPIRFLNTIATFIIPLIVLGFVGLLGAVVIDNQVNIMQAVDVSYECVVVPILQRVVDVGKIVRDIWRWYTPLHNAVWLYWFEGLETAFNIITDIDFADGITRAEVYEAFRAVVDYIAHVIFTPSAVEELEVDFFTRPIYESFANATVCYLNFTADVIVSSSQVAFGENCTKCGQLTDEFCDCTRLVVKFLTPESFANSSNPAFAIIINFVDDAVDSVCCFLSVFEVALQIAQDPDPFSRLEEVPIAFCDCLFELYDFLTFRFLTVWVRALADVLCCWLRVGVAIGVKILDEITPVPPVTIPAAIDAAEAVADVAIDRSTECVKLSITFPFAVLGATPVVSSLNRTVDFLECFAFLAKNVTFSLARIPTAGITQFITNTASFITEFLVCLKAFLDWLTDDIIAFLTTLLVDILDCFLQLARNWALDFVNGTIADNFVVRILEACECTRKTALFAFSGFFETAVFNTTRTIECAFDDLAKPCITQEAIKTTAWSDPVSAFTNDTLQDELTDASTRCYAGGYFFFFGRMCLAPPLVQDTFRGLVDWFACFSVNAIRLIRKTITGDSAEFVQTGFKLCACNDKFLRNVTDLWFPSEVEDGAKFIDTQLCLCQTMMKGFTELIRGTLFGGRIVGGAFEGGSCFITSPGGTCARGDCDFVPITDGSCHDFWGEMFECIRDGICGLFGSRSPAFFDSVAFNSRCVEISDAAFCFVRWAKRTLLRLITGGIQFDTTLTELFDCLDDLLFVVSENSVSNFVQWLVIDILFDTIIDQIINLFGNIFDLGTLARDVANIAECFADTALENCVSNFGFGAFGTECKVSGCFGFLHTCLNDGARNITLLEPLRSAGGFLSSPLSLTPPFQFFDIFDRVFCCVFNMPTTGCSGCTCGGETFSPGSVPSFAYGLNPSDLFGVGGAGRLGSFANFVAFTPPGISFLANPCCIVDALNCITAGGPGPVTAIVGNISAALQYVIFWICTVTEILLDFLDFIITFVTSAINWFDALFQIADSIFDIVRDIIDLFMGTLKLLADALNLIATLISCIFQVLTGFFSASCASFASLPGSPSNLDEVISFFPNLISKLNEGKDCLQDVASFFAGGTILSTLGCFATTPASASIFFDLANNILPTLTADLANSVAVGGIFNIIPLPPAKRSIVKREEWDSQAYWESLNGTYDAYGNQSEIMRFRDYWHEWAVRVLDADNTTTCGAMLLKDSYADVIDSKNPRNLTYHERVEWLQCFKFCSFCAQRKDALISLPNSTSGNITLQFNATAAAQKYTSTEQMFAAIYADTATSLFSATITNLAVGVTNLITYRSNITSNYTTSQQNSTRVNITVGTLVNGTIFGEGGSKRTLRDDQSPIDGEPWHSKMGRAFADAKDSAVKRSLEGIQKLKDYALNLTLEAQQTPGANRHWLKYRVKRDLASYLGLGRAKKYDPYADAPKPRTVEYYPSATPSPSPIPTQPIIHARHLSKDYTFVPRHHELFHTTIDNIQSRRNIGRYLNQSETVLSHIPAENVSNSASASDFEFPDLSAPSLFSPFVKEYFGNVTSEWQSRNMTNHVWTLGSFFFAVPSRIAKVVSELSAIKQRVQNKRRVNFWVQRNASALTRANISHIFDKPKPEPKAPKLLAPSETQPLDLTASILDILDFIFSFIPGVRKDLFSHLRSLFVLNVDPALAFEDFIKFLETLVSCDVPEDLDGTNTFPILRFNPFCFPLLYEPLFDILVFAIDNRFDWPDELIVVDCPPTDSCDGCVREYKSCRDINWLDGLDHIWFMIYAAPHLLNSLFNGNLLAFVAAIPFLFLIPGSTVIVVILTIVALVSPFGVIEADLVSPVVSAIESIQKSGVLFFVPSKVFDHLLLGLEKVSFAFTTPPASADIFCFFVTLSDFAFLVVLLVLLFALADAALNSLPGVGSSLGWIGWGISAFRRRSVINSIREDITDAATEINDLESVVQINAAHINEIYSRLNLDLGPLPDTAAMQQRTSGRSNTQSRSRRTQHITNYRTE